MRFHRRTDPELPDHHRRDRSAWDLVSRRHDHESSEAPRCWPHQMSASPSDPQSAPQPSWRSACGAATLPRTTKEGRGHWPLPSSHFTLSDACDSHTPSHALPDFQLSSCIRDAVRVASYFQFVVRYRSRPAEWCHLVTEQPQRCGHPGASDLSGIWSPALCRARSGCCARNGTNARTSVLTKWPDCSGRAGPVRA